MRKMLGWVSENKEKSIYLFSGAIVLLMLLFPPFKFVSENGVVFNHGYAFILAPPFDGYAVINVTVLIAQWIGVLAIAALGYLTVKHK